jgi:hypothetical protein
MPPVPRLTDEELLGALGRIPVYFEAIVLCDVEELTCRKLPTRLRSAGNRDVGSTAAALLRALDDSRSSAGRNLRPPMECRDVRELADSFLGEELLTETNHEILRHLDTCPACRADLAGRRALREGVQRAFHCAPDLGPRPEFIAQLRTKLQDTAHQGSARRGVRFHAWWALAATVLLAMALGLAYLGRDRITATGALARAAVGDHRYCASNSV